MPPFKASWTEGWLVYTAFTAVARLLGYFVLFANHFVFWFFEASAKQIKWISTPLYKRVTNELHFPQTCTIIKKHNNTILC